MEQAVATLRDRSTTVAERRGMPLPAVPSAR
jgi:hypothetical protein